MKLDLAKPVPGVLSPKSIQLCEASGIKINGKTLKPNRHRAYFDIALVPAFPQFNQFRSGFTAATLENSLDGLLHANFNLGHEMAANSKLAGRKIEEDRLVGNIVEVEFAPPDKNLTAPADAPFVRAVAHASKRAKGMDQILSLVRRGEQLMGSVEYYTADFVDSGIALLPAEGATGLDRATQESVDAHTPEDWKKLGYGYLPFTEAPEEMLNCYDRDAYQGYGGFVEEYRGHPLVTLWGGLNGEVEFFGAGLVGHSAFRSAKVLEIAAEDRPGMEAVKQLCDGLGRTMEKYYGQGRGNRR